MLAMVDVDSTLYDADALFTRLATEAGFGWVSASYTWFQPQDIGVPRETFTKMFRKAHSRDEALSQKPYPDAQLTLGWAQTEYPLDIFYVSNRSKQSLGALREWIAQEGFPQPENVIAHSDKREWLREMKPDIVIDDRVQTILMARYEIGAEVLSIKHNHNLNLCGEAPGIYICDDWNGIRTTLGELVLPRLELKEALIG